MLPDIFTQLQLDLFLSLALAVLCGGAIGLEREYSQHPAGLRTNILICVGAALIMELSVRVAGPSEVADPGRIAAQVVSGIGFLGAGSIIQSRGAVRGLTTAATIWVVAAIGLAIGAGEHLAAVGSTVLVLIVLIVLGWAERRYVREHRGHVISLQTTRDFRFSEIAGVIDELGLSVRTRHVTEHADGRHYQIKLSGAPQRIGELAHILMNRPDVESVRH